MFCVLKGTTLVIPHIVASIKLTPHLGEINQTLNSKFFLCCFLPSRLIRFVVVATMVCLHTWVCICSSESVERHGSMCIRNELSIQNQRQVQLSQVLSEYSLCTQKRGIAHLEHQGVSYPLYVYTGQNGILLPRDDEMPWAMVDFWTC